MSCRNDRLVLAAPLQRAGDETVLLQRLDEGVDVAVRQRAAPGNGDGLPDRHEGSRQNADIGPSPGAGFEGLSDGCDRIDIAPFEALQRRGRGRREDTLGGLEVAAEMEVVGGITADRDADAGPVDVVVARDGRGRGTMYAPSMIT